MWIAKGLLFCGVAAFAALTAYAYFGDLAPARENVIEEVTIERR